MNYSMKLSPWNKVMEFPIFGKAMETTGAAA